MRAPKNKTTRPLNLRYVTARQGKKKFWVAGSIFKYFKGQKFFLKMYKTTKVGLGQDSHAFDFDDKKKKFILAGINIKGVPPLKGNSDADVVLHAITNAFSSISGVPILGDIACELCLKQGILDSKVYLQKSLDLLPDWSIDHIALSIECKIPKILPHIKEMRESIAKIIKIPISAVGITATSGEGLSEFGKGKGIQVFALATVSRK